MAFILFSAFASSTLLAATTVGSTQLSTDGNLTVNGNTTLGNGTGDTITLQGSGTYTLGSVNSFQITATGSTLNTVSPLTITTTSATDANAGVSSVYTQSSGATGEQAAFLTIATQSSSSGGNLYGFQVEELQGTASSGTEAAFYQRGTAWDYGLLTQDTIRHELSGGVQVLLASTSATTLNSGGHLNLDITTAGPTTGTGPVEGIGVNLTPSGNTGSDADTFAGIGLHINNSTTDAATDDNIYGINIFSLSGTAKDADDTAMYIDQAGWDDGIKIDLSQPDDSDATDTDQGILINAATSASNDADTIVGIKISDLTVTGGGAPFERGLQIGGGWDANLFFDDTTSTIQIANTGTFTFEDSGGNDLLTLSDSSDLGNVGITGTLTVGSGTAISKILKGTCTVDPPDLAANATGTASCTSTGTLANDTVFLTPRAAPSTQTWSVDTVGSGSITIRFQESGTDGGDPASGTWDWTAIR